MTAQYAEEKRWVFSFDLKEEWRWMPDRERKRVPDQRSDVLKGSLPQGPTAHPRNTAYPSIRGWVKRARMGVELKQLREVWRRFETSIWGAVLTVLSMPLSRWWRTFSWPSTAAGWTGAGSSAESASSGSDETPLKLARSRRQRFDSENH